MHKSRSHITYVILLVIILCGCASTPPLPTSLNIIPPASDVSEELAAFSGMWRGRWNAYLDCILVFEKIDNYNADIIMSVGLANGVEPHYFYAKAKVTSNSTIEWIAPNGEKFTFTMDEGLNEIHGNATEEKGNYRGYFYRYIEEDG